MRSLRVLVLESNPHQLIATHQVLNAVGVFDVLTAQSFTAACLSLEARHGVDIAICELTMPGLEPGELIGHLAATGLARALIIFSTDTQQVEQLAALALQHRLPLLGMLSKPASAAAVHALLQEYQQTMNANASLPLLEVHEISHFDGAWPSSLRT